MNLIYTCKQRSAEWFELHIGRVTASSVADVRNFRKTGDKGPGADRIAYMGKKIAETLTGKLDMTGYNSPQMEWGTLCEDDARRAYCLAKETMVDQIGFGIHPRMERFGASPDGLIGEYGMLEIKAPATSTHLRWMMAGVVPEEHKAQMYSGLACFDRAWCDFISFDPRLPAHGLAPDGTWRNLQVFIAPRLVADEENIRLVENHVAQFLSEMDALIEGVWQRAPITDAPPQPQPVEGGITDEDIAWAQAQQV